MSLDTNSDGVASQQDRRVLGLIGAMKDGMVESFNYRSLAVQRVEDQIVVCNPDTMSNLGGQLYVKSGDLLGVKEWLDNKADLYRRGS